MADLPKVGSDAWWSAQAEKGINFGLGMLNTVLLTGKTSKNQQAEATTSVLPGMSGALPYIILGVVGVGIVLILAKR